MTSAEKTWQAWRERRNTTLASEHGWLTLVSFTWLGRETKTLPDFPGAWRSVGNLVSATFAPEDGVLRGTDPVDGEASFDLDDGDSDFSLSAGSRIAEVVKRGGRYAVRVRDSRAATRTSFTGVPVYAYDPDAVVTGVFEAYESPREVAIETANPELVGTARLVGEVTFEYAGVPCKLAVQGDELSLTAVFHDGTNGVETADWRNVSFPPPRSDDGEVTIDFNRSLNFPAAFTPFGTCPRPPAGNRIQAPVRAGERSPNAAG